MERRRFADLFEQHTGMNPSSYLTEYRIRRAKELLRSCDSTVAEIAECVGYVDCFTLVGYLKMYGYVPDNVSKDGE